MFLPLVSMMHTFLCSSPIQAALLHGCTLEVLPRVAGTATRATATESTTLDATAACPATATADTRVPARAVGAARHAYGARLHVHSIEHAISGFGFRV